MALNYNKVIIGGGATKDPETKQNENGETSIARIPIGVNRSYVKEGEQYPESDYINVVGYGKMAAFMEKHMRKGGRYLVEGEIRSDSYTNKDGAKVYTTYLLAQTVKFADSKANSAASNTSDKHESNSAAPEENNSDVGDISDYNDEDFADQPW